MLHENPVKGWLTIRGIQDAADADKDKRFRYVSTANAMITLEKILKYASKGFDDEIPRALK